MKIVAVGSIKDINIKNLIDNYKKMISRYHSLEIIMVKDENIKNESKLSNKDIESILDKEGKEILKHIEKHYVITLEIEGKNLSSIEFEKFLDEVRTNQTKKICFVIGGSYGLSEIVKNKSDFKLSFSKMTFPHNLMQIILLEQIFRACKIKNNEIYHK